MRSAATSLFQAIQDLVVIPVAPNPKPPEVVLSPERDGSVGSPDINRPDVPFGLEPKGRMKGISLEKLVLLDCQVLYLLGELCE